MAGCAANGVEPADSARCRGVIAERRSLADSAAAAFAESQAFEEGEVDRAPRLQNAGAVTTQLVREAARISDLVLPRAMEVRVRVMPDGAVAEAQVARSSGDAGVDLAALRVAQHARYSPGVLGRCAVPVWMRLPLVMGRQSGANRWP